MAFIFRKMVLYLGFYKRATCLIGNTNSLILSLQNTFNKLTKCIQEKLKTVCVTKSKTMVLFAEKPSIQNIINKTLLLKCSTFLLLGEYDMPLVLSNTYG